MADSIRIADLRAFVFRAPIPSPVRTSFGLMLERPAVLVRVQDAEGAVGWGEIWCNFPPAGAEHRARLVEQVIAPLVVGQVFTDPSAVNASLSQRLRVLALQSGEPGPIAQAIAGIDIALWDLAAKRAGEPLWRLLGGSPTVAVYASGLNPDHPERLAEEKYEEGFRAFKLKVGFGPGVDEANLKTLRCALGDEARIMIDANQAWEPEEAFVLGRRFKAYDPFWLEEPIAADHSLAIWKALAEQSPIPLAGGENLRGQEAFDEVIAARVFGVVQPDIGKWGGYTGCLAVGRKARAAGLLFCPHWLGGGIGLVASLHLLAAVGGGGMVEVDANPNPLRELIASPHLRIFEGVIALPEAPGLGIEPDWVALGEFRVPV